MSDESKLKSLASDVIERRNEARKYYKEQVYDELTEVVLNLKCRTRPVFKKDSAGNDTNIEDTSRTNVAMPDTNIIYRRNTARMTAQPYRLRYIGGSNPEMAEMLSALAMQQYSRSDEQWHDRRVVGMGEAFGFGYSKLYVDKLERVFPKRMLLAKGKDILVRDRKLVMASMGAPEDEIAQAVAELGNQMSDDEVNMAVAQNGPEITVPTPILKYMGPCLKSVFIGDLFLEPGAMSMNDSNFIIEQYAESDLWLKKMLGTTFQDEDGKWVPAFDEKSCADLLSKTSDMDEPMSSDDLKREFDDALGFSSDKANRFKSHLRPRKKWKIIEQHALEDDGRIWITWVAEKLSDRPLGRMPYPFDLNGKYVYSEYVPLQDFISPWGDSTPRLLRYLQAMKNLTVAQNFDYVTNVIKKLLLMKMDANTEPEVIERGLMRILKVDNVSDFQYLQEPQLPAGAFERIAHLNSEIGKLEPSINNVESGSSLSPMAGKTATTAILAARVADALTQFKIDGRNLYLKDVGEKKLWMNQQIATDAWEIEKEFWGDDLNKRVDDVEKLAPENRPQWALSDSHGKVAAVRLDPYEIQEDLRVEPEAGSYLAVDDEIFQESLMKVQAVAQANPGVIDTRKLVRKQLAHIRGIGNPDELFLPEDNGPQLPETRMNVSLSIAFKDLPHDVQNQLLPMIGLQPSQELALQGTLSGVEKLNDAATAAAELQGPAQPEAEGLAVPNLPAR